MLDAKEAGLAASIEELVRMRHVCIAKYGNIRLLGYGDRALNTAAKTKKMTNLHFQKLLLRHQAAPPTGAISFKWLSQRVGGLRARRSGPSPRPNTSQQPSIARIE